MCGPSLLRCGNILPINLIISESYLHMQILQARDFCRHLAWMGEELLQRGRHWPMEGDCGTTLSFAISCTLYLFSLWRVFYESVF